MFSQWLKTLMMLVIACRSRSVSVYRGKQECWKLNIVVKRYIFTAFTYQDVWQEVNMSGQQLFSTQVAVP